MQLDSLVQVAHGASTPKDFEDLMAMCQLQGIHPRPPLNLKEFEKKYNGKDTTDYQAELDAALTCIFKEIQSINLILVFGYTPSFNDGDPCTHGQTLSVEGFGLEDMYAFFDDCEDDEETDYGSKSYFEGEHGVKVPEKVETYKYDEGNYKRVKLKGDPKEWKRIHSLLENMEGLFENCYGTDWKIVIKRTGPETFDLNKDHYHPEY